MSISTDFLKHSASSTAKESKPERHDMWYKAAKQECLSKLARQHIQQVAAKQHADLDTCIRQQLDFFKAMRDAP